MTIAMTPTATRSLAAGPSRRASSARDELRRRLDARFRRRRAIVGLLAAVVVGVGALVADSVLTGPGGVPASAAGAGTATQGSAMAVRVDLGDSLWSIAEAHHGDVPITRYVEALISLNGGTVIQVGQLVRLP